MAIDLTPLLEPLTRGEGPDLDATDERLVAIDTLADRGQFEAAARGVEELVREGIYDIRPLPYLLYQAFVEGGLAGLVTVLGVLENVLGPSFEALSPERRRAEYANKRLAWLFETTQRWLEYHQKLATAEWRALCSKASPDDLEQAMSAAARLLERLGAPENAAAATALGQLLTRLRQCESALAAEPPSPPSAPTAPAESVPASVPSAIPVSTVRPKDGLVRMELFVAPPFLELCRKLEAFAALVD